MFSTDRDMLTIGIIDPFPIMLTGLSMLITSQYKGARFLTARTLVKFKRNQPPEEPFIIILSVSNSILNNRLNSVKTCKEAFPASKIIVYDYTSCHEDCASYFMAGADGYLGGQDDKQRLIACIESIIARSRFSKSVPSRL
ncbi:response regulator [Dyadobacter aurulentus]|uniref:response regulator transcription factor n=1 Tax=Dyadobacter sp. UC 10 TaxID=2605428 RepID=UPI0011F3E970|nr:response regulator transcription factor [Dyadobacter sp. UC 10]KAA0993508.1 response regulator transcription factor [Dyadobacter sp. UC 10]